MWLTDVIRTSSITSASTDDGTGIGSQFNVVTAILGGIGCDSDVHVDFELFSTHGSCTPQRCEPKRAF